jgi:hypothetical protein
MAKATDFDPRMIRLATQLAHSRKQRGLLLTALDVLLKTVRGELGVTKHSEFDVGCESVVLVRCLIRLVNELMTAPDANRLAFFLKMIRLCLMVYHRIVLLETAIRHYQTGIHF